MSSKIKLVYLPGRIASLNTDWMRPLVENLFEFEAFDPNKNYPVNTLFYVNDSIVNEPGQVDSLLDRGFKIVYDNLWELPAPPNPTMLILHNPAWFWYYESLWYTHIHYNDYRPNRNPTYLALMPMNLQRPHRDSVVQQLGSTLDRMLWSYVAQGRQLPNDQDMTIYNTQRYINSSWFDQSYCSLVVESSVNPANPPFITEKTFKPIAFQHPFLICGPQYSLRTLRELGFATFDNIWDESYDNIANTPQRIAIVINTLKRTEITPHSADTMGRLEHNCHRFFDTKLVAQRIVEEILNPIIEYAET